MADNDETSSPQESTNGSTTTNTNPETTADSSNAASTNSNDGSTNTDVTTANSETSVDSLSVSTDTNDTSNEQPKNVDGTESNNDEVDVDSLPLMVDAYSTLIDEDDIQYFENSRGKMIISVYAVNKGLGKERIDKKYCFKLPLKSTIRNIILNQNIYGFGTSCTMIVSANNNNLLYFLERSELWHIVVNIGIPVDDENTSSFYRLEPYIFDIDKVITVSHESNVDVYTLHLDDIYTSIAKHRSWASLVKWYNPVMQSASYTDVVYNVFQYLNDLLRLETHNIYAFRKELLCQIDSFAAREIVATSLKRIKPTASIYEGLKTIWEDIQVSFDYDEAFSAVYETLTGAASPVVRAFFQEEYADPCGVYTSILKNLIDEENNGSDSDSDIANQDNTSTDSTSSSNVTDSGENTQSQTTNNSTSEGDTSQSSATSELPNKKQEYITNITTTLTNSSNILKRVFSLRSMYLPFGLAFATTDEDIKGSVWEIINNPSEELEDDPTFRIFTNVVSSPVNKYTKYPLDPSLTYKSWKNYIFQTETCVSGGKGQFVFFNWVKSLFQWMFLGNKDKNRDCFIIPVVPGFSVLETDADRKKGSPTIVNFNEGNCVVKPIKTPAFEQEVMWNIGKELSSMVLYNNEYSFNINGNWLRRPNEIVKLYCSGTDNTLDVQNDEIFTDIFGNKFVMLYLTSVSHVIDCTNNTFTDEIHVLKACEYLR